jgi:hypothetical protein
MRAKRYAARGDMFFNFLKKKHFLKSCCVVQPIHGIGTPFADKVSTVIGLSLLLKVHTKASS